MTIDWSLLLLAYSAASSLISTKIHHQVSEHNDVCSLLFRTNIHHQVFVISVIPQGYETLFHVCLHGV